MKCCCLYYFTMTRESRSVSSFIFLFDEVSSTCKEELTLMMCWHPTEAISRVCCVSVVSPVCLSMEGTYVRHVELLGFEKRSFPGRHYVRLNTFTLKIQILLKSINEESSGCKWRLPKDKTGAVVVYTVCRCTCWWWNGATSLRSWSTGRIPRSTPSMWAPPAPLNKRSDLCTSTNEVNQINLKLLFFSFFCRFMFFVAEISEGDVSHRVWSNRKEGPNHPVITR